MSYAAKRNEIIALANSLGEQRRALLDTIGQINVSISALCSLADTLLPLAADESTGRVSTKRISYDGPPAVAADLAGVKDVVDATRKRKCKICGKSGHDKRNCDSAKAIAMRRAR